MRLISVRCQICARWHNRISGTVYHCPYCGCNTVTVTVNRVPRVSFWSYHAEQARFIPAARAVPIIRYPRISYVSR